MSDLASFLIGIAGTGVLFLVLRMMEARDA